MGAATIQLFQKFLHWYNYKDVVRNLKAIQKLIAIYHDRFIDTLKLGCTLPNLANTILHKSIETKFYPFTESDKDLSGKIRGDVVGGPPTVFTCKALVYESFVRKSTILSKSFVGIDASEQYPYSMCQPTPTGLYTRWDLDPGTSRFKPRQNNTRGFSKMVISYVQGTSPNRNIESFFKTGKQKKLQGC